MPLSEIFVLACCLTVSYVQQFLTIRILLPSPVMPDPYLLSVTIRVLLSSNQNKIE